MIVSREGQIYRVVDDSEERTKWFRLKTRIECDPPVIVETSLEDRWVYELINGGSFPKFKIKATEMKGEEPVKFLWFSWANTVDDAIKAHKSVVGMYPGKTEDLIWQTEDNQPQVTLEMVDLAWRQSMGNAMKRLLERIKEDKLSRNQQNKQ